MTERIPDIVDKVLQQNAYFVHPKNILIVMLLDNEEYVREFEWRRILKSLISSPVEAHIFFVPKLLLNSQNVLCSDRLAVYCD